MKKLQKSTIAAVFTAVASVAVVSGCSGNSATTEPSTGTVDRQAAWGYKSSEVCVVNHGKETIHVQWAKYDSVTGGNPSVDVAPNKKTCAEGQNVGDMMLYKAFESARKKWPYDVSGTITEGKSTAGNSVSFTAENSSFDFPVMYMWSNLDESTLMARGAETDGRDLNLDALELEGGVTEISNGVPYMAVNVTRLPDTDWKRWELTYLQ